jgi:branched-chain amino acid transport system ATP-binding protein
LTEMPAFTIENLRVRFKDSNVELLHASRLSLDYGLNYLTGRNGSGKTTLLRALAGSHAEVILAGQVAFEGSGLAKGIVGFVSQDPMASICGELSFGDNLLLSCLRSNAWLSLRPLGSGGRSKAVAGKLDELGMAAAVSGLLTRQAKLLSGGERQLLAILMRVCHGNRLLLLDECTASLDEENTRKVMSVLHNLRGVRCVALMATHDLELIDDYNAPVFNIHSHEVAAQRHQPAGQVACASAPAD